LTATIGKNRISVSIARASDAAVGVTKALAGVSGWATDLKRHSHILIKPNLCGGVAGEPGSHTSSAVLAAVLEIATSFSLPIYIGEADCSFNDAEQMFERLAIYQLAKKYGGRVINLSTGPVRDVAVSHPLNIKTLRVAEVLVSAFIISVPVLKTHPWSGVTITMKNMYGATYLREKSLYHNGLEENIVDINKVICPNLSVVDATVAVVHGGFKYGLWVGCPPSRLDRIVAGINPVAVDAVGATMLGCKPADIGHIRCAAQQGMGPCSLEEINLLGDDVVH